MATAADSSIRACVRIQLLSFGTLPAGGPPAAQPSRPVSNDVFALDTPSISTSVSSTKTPSPATNGSVA